MDEGPPGGDSPLTRTGLPPGKYDVALMQMPGYAVASTTLNGTPVLPGATIDLESSESLLTFVLTTQLGSVTGMVRDSDGQAVADATVVVAAELFADTSGARFALPPGAGEMVVADGSGRFVVSGLAAGRYKVIALKGGDRRGLIDTGSIRERMRLAEGVVVSAGQSTNLELVAGK